MWLKGFEYKIIDKNFMIYNGFIIVYQCDECQFTKKR